MGTSDYIQNLITEWNALQPAEGTLQWYRRYFAQSHTGNLDMDRNKAEAMAYYHAFTAEDEESGLTGEQLLDAYRVEYEQLMQAICDAERESLTPEAFEEILDKARAENNWGFSGQYCATATVVTWDRVAYVIVLSNDDKLATVRHQESGGILAENLPSGL